jgi:hypothetical protein
VKLVRDHYPWVFVAVSAGVAIAQWVGVFHV